MAVLFDVHLISTESAINICAGILYLGLRIVDRWENSKLAVVRISELSKLGDVDVRRWIDVG